MIIKLTNTDSDAENLPEITSTKIFTAGRFERDGLFSQQIFGPTKSFSCACSRNSGIGRTIDHIKCPNCGVELTSSSERRDRFAKIVLPFPILNPIFYYLLVKIKPSIKNIFNNLISSRCKYYYDENNLLTEIPEQYEIIDNPNVIILSGLDGIIKIIQNIIDVEEDREECRFIRDHFECVTIKNVLVIPPELRPCEKDDRGSYVADEINSLYIQLLIKTNHMKSIPFTVPEKDEIFKTNFKHIQTKTIEIYDYILEKLSKKKGLIRSNILGKRVDFSGRAVISPDPTLKLDQCRVPYFMLLEILKPQLVSHLVNRKVCKRYNQASEYIDKCIDSKDETLFNIVYEFCKNKICVLNRQPTLHRLSVLAFKILAHMGNTIQIHPLVCAPYNADFDGDSIDGEVELIVSEKMENVDGPPTSILPLNVSMSVIPSLNLFEQTETKTKENGVIVTKYKPNKEITIKSINRDNGEIQYKKISDFSVHENIKMFKISDKSDSKRFESFWSSEDHSMLIYDENTKQIKEISPKELLQTDLNGKFLIKSKK